MRPVEAEDTHFYIDNAPPDEVAMVLRCLSPSEPLTTDEIAERLASEYGFTMQRHKTESPRRLFDLGLAVQVAGARRLEYTASSLGVQLRAVLTLDQTMFWDLMHFLHYSLYCRRPDARKYLWSYRRCCDLAWEEGRLPPKDEMAAKVQALMRQEFVSLDFSARVGARFDSTAVGRWLAWIRRLAPCPFPQNQDSLQKRGIQRHELSLLSLDYVYHMRGYRYGDPVVLDDNLLDEMGRVFFLDPVCCRQLLDIAGRMSRSVVLKDTFAGTSVTLMAPYKVENV
jgi:hypothetical protein